MDEDSQSDPKRRRVDSPQRRGSLSSEHGPPDNLQDLSKEQLCAMLQGLERENENLKREKKNRSFETLLSLEEGKLKVVGQGGNVSHRPRNHEKAIAESRELELCEPDIAKLKKTPEVSRLLLQFVDQANLGEELQFNDYAYDHEADLSFLLRNAAEDAIKILEIEGRIEKNSLAAALERSIFSCRPDVMTVRRDKNTCVLAIEVKKELNKFGDLPNEGKILGHAFDHAQAMDAWGQGNPIAVVTTFAESIMCSIDSTVFDEEEISSSGRECVVASPGVSQAETQSPVQFKKPVQFKTSVRAANENETTMPRTQRTVTFDSSPPSSESSSHGEQFESLFTASLPRQMWRSQSYKPHELVKLLYTALKIALDKYRCSSRTTWKLLPGERLRFPKVLRAVESEQGYTWGELHFQLGQKISSRASKPKNESTDRKAKQRTLSDDSKAYYIFGSLGHGATSNVFHAVDSDGKEVALKVYLNNVTGDDRPMTADEFEEKAKDTVTREQQNLVEIYRFLKDKVHVKKIFGLWCVEMPVFEPVAKQDRRDRLPEVKEVLEKYFQTKGLMHDPDDVKWRHVGIYRYEEGKEQCVLYDLAELYDAVDDFVDQHCERLAQRIPAEPVENEDLIIQQEEGSKQFATLLDTKQSRRT